MQPEQSEESQSDQDQTQTDQPQTPWHFTNDQPDPAAAQAPVPRTSAQAVQWTASEFVAHQKGGGWYFILAIITTVLSAGIFLLTQDVITVGVIIFAAIIFGIVAARKPRVLQYSIDNSGLHIEDKLYHYESFKSFAVIEEDAIHSVQLMPMKRFMPALSIYYAPEDEDKIVDALADYLPFQPAQNDFIDRFMRKIRF